MRMIKAANRQPMSCKQLTGHNGGTIHFLPRLISGLLTELSCRKKNNTDKHNHLPAMLQMFVYTVNHTQF